MKGTTLAFALVTASLRLLTIVHGFPNRAGACPKGEQAVGPAHTSGGNARNFETGGLVDGSVNLSVAGTDLPAGFQLRVLPELDYSMTISANDAPIRGVLIRIECKTDLTGALTPTDNLLDNADVCGTGIGEIVGLSHNSSVPKEEITVILNLPVPTTVSLDVTVVMANNATDSIWYYNGYSIRAAYPACEICGAGLVPRNKDAEFNLPPDLINGLNATTASCGDIESAALAGSIRPNQCRLDSASANVCDCGEEQACVPVNMPCQSNEDCCQGSGGQRYQCSAKLCWKAPRVDASGKDDPKNKIGAPFIGLERKKNRYLKGH